MKGTCSICNLLGFVCFLLVTKPHVGYTLREITVPSRTSSAHSRRNEERQPVQANESRCFMDILDTGIQEHRRSDQQVQGTRNIPFYDFSTRHRLPIKERPIPRRPQISQILRPPTPVPNKGHTNLIYFTTPTPIVENTFNYQTSRPISHGNSQFKPPLLINFESAVNSAAQKPSSVSSTDSPVISLGSYSSANHHLHSQKQTYPISNTVTNAFHTSAQPGKLQQNAVVRVTRPINSNPPAPELRPLPLKPLVSVSNGNNKEVHSANTFQHVNIPGKIYTQMASILPPQLNTNTSVSVPQIDNVKRETYHITKPVVENSADSKLTLSLKSENEQKLSQQNRQDLKSSSNELGYFYPGVQTTGPLGHLGFGPYGLDVVHLAEQHNPVANSLLISSLWNPALGLGLGGVGKVVPYHYGRDPIVNLLLKQYGRYLPYGLGSYGLYGYSAPSNVDNSKPFGLYKYEDRI